MRRSVLAGAATLASAAALLGTAFSSRVALSGDPPDSRDPSLRVHGMSESPPWIEPGDLPIPTYARSVRVKPSKEPASPQMGPVILGLPGILSARRGTAAFDAVLPIFGAKRGGDCLGRWLLVGPLAWICSDAVEISREVPPADDAAAPPYRYYFVGRDGAEGFEAPELAEQSTPIQEYEPGFGVAIVEERRVGSATYGKTPSGRWINRSELGAARLSAFHGEELGAVDIGQRPTLEKKSLSLPVAWATANVGAVDKSRASLKRREFVTVVGEERVGKALQIRVKKSDGVTLLVREKDLVRPTLEAPPMEVSRGERWIDVDRAKQMLVAYEGEKPVFATLVSTGKGAEGSDTATPKGSFRVWVKLATSNMDNLEDEDMSQHFSLEDVPYVQFFQKGVALHGAFWHDDFGIPRSHGCVNLSLADAAWLFRFTGPHLPAGWSAVLPSDLTRGTVIRVR